MSSAAAQPDREPKYYTVKRHLLAQHRVARARQRGADRTRTGGRTGDLAHDCAAGAARTGRRRPAGAAPGVGHVRRRTEDGLAAAPDQLHRAGRRQRFHRVDAPAGRRPGPGRRHASPRSSASTIGAGVWQIERLRLADDRPMAVETSHLSAQRFPQLSRHIRREQSLYAILDRVYGVVAGPRRGIDLDSAGVDA